MRGRQGLAATILTGVAAAALLAGCSGGFDGTSATSGGSGAEGAPQRAADSAVEGGSSAKSGAAAPNALADQGGRSTSARVLPPGRDVVYRGQITVRVKDVAAASARAESSVSAVDGVVFAEETTTNPGRRETATASLTLRVPPSQFRPLLDRLATLGTQLSRSQTAEDVTTQVVDLESRLASQRRSVARIRALLDEATTIGQIVQVEGELARREADLESLEAQQAKLKDITDLATIELSLVERGVKSPAEDDEDFGFLVGLRGGVGALLAAVVVGLTVAGAALPFAITLALVGVPVWLVVRRRRTTSGGAEPSAPAATG
jgi:uncharacterized protein DUF4349